MDSQKLDSVSSLKRSASPTYNEANELDRIDVGITGDDDSNRPERRQIGLISAIFIIFNRIIGTGYVFSTVGHAPQISHAAFIEYSPLQVQY